MFEVNAVLHWCDKRLTDGSWKINYVYKSDGYISFDKRGKNAEWLTYLLDRYLAD